MISIIVPSYNAEKYILECVQSILGQTFQDFEIIIVDDGSKDDTYSICAKMAREDSRIRVIKKENGGVSSARNVGLENAKGELIAFADADDILKPELLSTLYDCMKEYNVDRVCGGYVHFYADGNQVYRKSRIPDGYYDSDEILPKMIDDGSMSGFMFSGVYNSLFIKKIIDNNMLRFHEGIKYNEDGLFSFEYALHSKNLYSLRSKPLYMYRQHGESATRTRKKGDKYALLHTYLDSLDFDKTKCHYILQMKRRYATIALWDIMEIAKADSRKVAVKKIRKILVTPRVVEGLEVVHNNDLNRYKKVYYSLMRSKSSFTLFYLTKYILPYLSKFLSR